MIRVYDAGGNVIETYEHKGQGLDPTTGLAVIRLQMAATATPTASATPTATATPTGTATATPIANADSFADV